MIALNATAISYGALSGNFSTDALSSFISKQKQNVTSLSVLNSHNETSDFFGGDQETKLFAWVDLLNIRKEPSLSSTVIAQVREGEELLYLGIQSTNNIEVSLRGKKYNGGFYKVRTNDGSVGWVHSATVVNSKSQYDKLKRAADSKKTKAKVIEPGAKPSGTYF